MKSSRLIFSMLVCALLAAACAAPAGTPGTDPRQPTAAPVGTEPLQPASTPTEAPAGILASATPRRTPQGSPLAEPTAPAPILIYAVQGQPVSTPPADRDYAQDVLRAVQADLAGRLGVAEGALALVEQRQVEAALADPCGSGLKVESGTLGGGLTIGLETRLQAGEGEHRYVAVGGLAYYCGQQ